MAFSTAAQLLGQYDARTIGMLVSDTDNAVTADMLATDTNVLQALNQATGRMTVAFRVGQRYSAADIATLVTAAGPSADYLSYICNVIAFGILWDRRPTMGDDPRADKAREHSEKMLKELRTGEAIFDIDANTEASIPVITGPSTQTIINLNGVADRYGRGHVFPRRQLPNNR